MQPVLNPKSSTTKIFIIAFGYSLSGYFSLIRAKFKTSKNFLDVDIFDEK